MQPRFVKRGILAGLVTAAAFACDEGVGPTPSGGAGGGVQDDIKPTVTITLADSLIDINEGLQFTVSGNDNISLLTIGWSVRGAVTKDSIITFTTTTQSFASTFTITEGFTGGTFTITAGASDGAGNLADSVTATARVFDALPPTQTLIAPVAGDQFNTGSTMAVVVNVDDPSGVAQITASLFARDQFSQPVDIVADTTNITAPLSTSIEDTLSIPIPNSLLPGTYEVRTSATDGATPPRSGFSGSINVSILDGVAPGGSFISPPVDSLIIAGDPFPVRFRATDLTGVDSVVFTTVAIRGVDSLGTSLAVERYLPKTAIINQSRDTSIIRILDPVLTDSTAEQVRITGTVYDVGETPTSITTTVQIVTGPNTEITAPTDGATVPVGVPLAITILASSPDAIATVYAVASGAVTGADTVQFVAPLSQVVSQALSIPVAANAALGDVKIAPFAIDGAGRLVPGDTVTVSLTDLQPPTIIFSLPDSAFLVRTRDSVRVSVQVQDNKGVSLVTLDGVAHRGLRSLGTDTVIQRFDVKTIELDQSPDTLLLRDLLATAGDETAETAYVRVIAQDSSGNIARDSVPIEVIQGPALTILLPADSSVVSPGKDISITVRGQAQTGIRKIGYTTSGALTVQDTSTIIATTNPQIEDTTHVFTLSVPDTTTVGFFSVQPFGRDSLGNVGTGSQITVEIVASGGVSDITPPLVTDSVELRTESDDTILVRATDVGGISLIGYAIIDLSTSDTLAAGSNSFGGTSTDVSVKFELGLDSVTRFPLEVYVTAYAEDSVGNRGVLSRSGIALSVADGEAADTVTLVAGHTVSLPDGGVVADAIYSRNLDEVYLTNPDLDQVEVFDIGTTAFQNPIIVGSRPWGIGLWPKDTLGNHADTIIVANSGGTNLSIVDVTGGVRQEQRRHALPNFEVHRVISDPDDIASSLGRLRIIITQYDFSDRPQFLGMVCRPTTGGTACAADSVMAVYSTTPTASQGVLFDRRGTVRWENLTACKDVAPRPTGEACLDAVEATGTLTLTANPLDTETVTIGGKVYAFRTGPLIPLSVDGTVEIGATASASLDNLVAAIGLGPGAGTTYAILTTAHPTVDAAAAAGDAVTLTAKTAGVGGNTIGTTETLVNGSFGAATLTGGLSNGVPQSHFFYEHAQVLAGEGADTLQIWMVRGRDTTVLLSAASTVTVDLAAVSFRDTTFVRNSGNFARALIGEGPSLGDDDFARVVAYDATVGSAARFDTLVIVTDTLFQGVNGFTFSGDSSVSDAGLSPGIEVRDFISNTAIPVRSIGVNFNGGTNLVRADSIYVLNKFLRLTGIVGAPGENPGMDLNFDHDFDASEGGTPIFGGSGDPDNRLLFAAREDPNIGVYDTWNFGLVTTVPIRDPVIGPLRVAKISATNEQLLIGVTKRGIVTVRLPSITNIFLSPSFGGGPDRPDR